tara:strand:- start:725 stop:2953 length:2229 start_codon:yes stop_codon:yes gene_type:complete
MSVNLEIKGTLAKLLATEDLIIENKDVETAAFNVQTRVLTLPMWDKADESVYDMLVGHEVGHALYTPNRDPKVDVPQAFLNVTEDARIEKLMKRKYLGLGKTFKNGYQILFEDDFFNLANEDINDLTLADKINLHYKIGAFLAIWFTEQEQEIVDLVGASETFEEAEHAAEVLYNYCREAKEQEEEDEDSDTENAASIKMDMGSSATTTDGDNSEEEAEEEEEGDSKGEGDEEEAEGKQENEETKETPSMTDGKPEESDNKEPEVQTDELLRQKISDLISRDSLPNEYLTFTDVDIDTVVAKNEDVHAYIEKTWREWEQDVLNDPEQRERYLNRNGDFYYRSNFNTVDASFDQYKKDAQKAVNYLIKEFEMKKAASAYARSATSKTGVLDCTKLHTYKFNEDLFKKVTTFADGQSHGLIFVLDWSGSMQTVMKDTLKQLYNLIWFCKKTNIPFKVFAFTYEWNRLEYHPETHLPIPYPDHYTPKEGEFVIDSRFSMMEFFNSNVRTPDLEKQMKNIWRVAHSFRDYTEYPTPHKLSLSGTPLNEAIVSLNQIIPAFREECKMEKVNVVVLSDGEAHHLHRHREVKRHWENEMFMGSCQINSQRDYIRNRKTGRTYKIPSRYHEFTQLLIKYLTDIHKGVNFVGIRLMESRDHSYMLSRYCMIDSPEYIQAKKEWKKSKSFSIKVEGYAKYFGMSNSVLSATETTAVLTEAPTKAQIKSYFNRSLKDKRLNKKVLSEFVELIA